MGQVVGQGPSISGSCGESLFLKEACDVGGQVVWQGTSILVSGRCVSFFKEGRRCVRAGGGTETSNLGIWAARIISF